MKNSQKNLLGISYLSRLELTLLLELATALEKKRAKKRVRTLMQNMNVALLFAFPSLRTRAAFSNAATQLGGRAESFKGDEIGMGNDVGNKDRESVPDVARTLLALEYNVIGARVKHDDHLVQLAENSELPVINLLSPAEHPTQILADLLTVKQNFGRLKGLRWAYFGDGTNNMAASYMYACALLDMPLCIASPKPYQPAEETVERAKKIAHKRNWELTITDNPEDAARNTDVFATDIWKSPNQSADTTNRIELMAPFQVTSKLMSWGAENRAFLECLPAHRNEEVTPEVIDGPYSLVWLEAHNRLVAARAVYAYTLGQARRFI